MAGEYPWTVKRVGEYRDFDVLEMSVGITEFSRYYSGMIQPDQDLKIQRLLQNHSVVGIVGARQDSNVKRNST